jgi:hypothetical protein
MPATEERTKYYLQRLRADGIDPDNPSPRRGYWASCRELSAWHVEWLTDPVLTAECRDVGASPINFALR